MFFSAAFLGDFLTGVSRPQFLRQVAAQSMRIVLILVLAWIASRVVRRMMRTLHAYTLRMMTKRTGSESFDQQHLDLDKRTATLTGVAGRTMSVVIWVFGVIMTLRELGFDITPLIAGAGVAGIGISLGAQNVIKDLIGGVFLLLDNQIRVGDAVMINDVGGIVEEINLRTTLVRSENGGLHIFQNGGIQKLANNSREFVYFVFEFTVNHRQDPDAAISIIRDVTSEVAADPSFAPFVLAPPEVFGVDRITDTGLVIKGRVKTLPGKQWPTGREMNRRMKLRFEADGILRAAPVMDLRLASHATPGDAWTEAARKVAGDAPEAKEESS
ncbi:MAG: mechanosensitive ion channel family protein [Bryobacteraceae bacterium]